MSYLSGLFDFAFFLSTTQPESPLGMSVLILREIFNVLISFICFWPHHAACGASPVAQTVKNLPAMQETGVRFLGQEDPLEKEMATHSSIFAWRILWTEESGGLQSMGSQRVGHDQAINMCSM